MARPEEVGVEKSVFRYNVQYSACLSEGDRNEKQQLAYGIAPAIDDDRKQLRATFYPGNSVPRSESLFKESR